MGRSNDFQHRLVPMLLWNQSYASHGRILLSPPHSLQLIFAKEGVGIDVVQR